MKKFFTNVFLFLLPLFVLLVGVELVARSIPNNFRYKTEWMDKNKESVQILVLGESATYRAVNTGMLRNAFCLANPSQVLEIDSFLLSKYIGECPQLKTVILPLDYGNIFHSSYEDRGGKDWNLAIYYNLYMGYNKHGIFSKYHYETSCPRILISKLSKYLSNTCSGKGYRISCDSLGWGGQNNEDQEIKNMSDKKIRSIIKQTSEFDIKSVRKNRKYIHSIIKICKDNNIRLILLHTPYYFLYNQHIDRVKLGILNKNVREIEMKEGIEYFDYRDDARFSKNERFFMNPTHMLPVGADAFTEILKKECNL